MKINVKSFEELSTATLYQILKLRVDVFVVEQNCPYPELDGLDQDAIHFFTEDHNYIPSYLRVYFPESGKAKIGRVAVHPDHRKDGLGRKLMEAAMTYLEEHEEINSIVLQAQEYLVKFYTSFGFQPISEVYLEDGIPHVDMEFVIRNS